MERLWRAYMVLGGFGLAAGLLLPSEGAGTVAYQAVAAVALAALATAHRAPPARPPRRLVGAAGRVRLVLRR